MRFTRLLAALALAFTLVVGNVSAQETIRESNQGRLWWSEINEVIMDSKIADASKFRVGAPFELGESGGGGAFSFDVIDGLEGSPAGRRVEAVLITGSMNSFLGGELGIHILKRGTGANISDAAQIKVMETTSEYVQFNVPVRFTAGTSGGSNLPSSPPPSTVRPSEQVFSPNGTFVLAVQDDGNLVQYQVVDTTWCPRWASIQGLLPNSMWPNGHVCR